MGKDLATALEDAFIALAKRKSAHNASAPLLGLGVTLPCPITKGTANRSDYNSKDDLISDEIAAKRSDAILQRARDRFNSLFPAVKAPVKISDNKTVGHFLHAKDFDDLGRTHGETSYIGVVHIDGNGMAGKIAAVTDKYRDPLKNYEYRKKCTTFQRKLKASGEYLKMAIGWLLNSLASSDKNGECFCPLS